MTRAAEILWVAALASMVGATWLAWHGRPVTALVVAVNAVTSAILALTSVAAARRRP